jgi:outer membrane protein OmpA-like peptidoglycan-associated protein
MLLGKVYVKGSFMSIKKRFQFIFNSPLGFIIGQLILIIFATILAFSLQAQDYQKSNKKFYKSYYRKQTTLYVNACNLLERKRHKKPAQVAIAKSYRSNIKSVLAIDPNAVVAKAGNTTPDVKLVPRPLPGKPKIEEISPEKLEALHTKEDEVLEKNHLPKTTSEKQAEIRTLVGDKLASKKNIYPLNLDPLYFNFNEDEFSVVDMEPFLVAAEYALQGRTVLIEGHTDSEGHDRYNVKLSIKRVQKIRQLMLDMGVPDDRISVVGYGEELKQNDNATETGRQLNRRVDFTIF